MRLVRALKFLLLLWLAVTLFGCEVGESACFDISNDYIGAPASPVHQLAQRAPAHVVFQGSFNHTRHIFTIQRVQESATPCELIRRARR